MIVVIDQCEEIEEERRGFNFYDFITLRMSPSKIIISRPFLANFIAKRAAQASAIKGPLPAIISNHKSKSWQLVVDKCTLINLRRTRNTLLARVL